MKHCARVCSGMPAAAIVMLVGALLHPAPAQAQVGVTAGFSSSTLAFIPSSSLPSGRGAYRPGFVGGALFDVSREHRVGMRMEVLVRQAGTRSLFEANDEIRLTYLDIPLLLRLKVGGSHRGAAFVLAGPTVSYNLKSTYVNGTQTDDIHDDAVKPDIGITLGGGLDAGRMTFSARYTWGLVMVLDIGGPGGSFKNRSLTATAGVRFGR